MRNVILILVYILKIWSGIKQNLLNHTKTDDNINSKLFEIIWRIENKNNEWNAFINVIKANHIQ